jgi:hypothetical protein
MIAARVRLNLNIVERSQHLKKQLVGDMVRGATSDEVKHLHSENRELKEVVAEITLSTGSSISCL